MVIIGNLKYRAIDSNGEYNFRRDIELPYDAEIEYLGFTSGCSLDTGIYPSTNYKYSWRYLWKALTNYVYPFTNKGSNGSWFIFGGIETTQRTEIHIKSTSMTSGLNLSANTLYDGSFGHVGNNLTLTCNNDSISINYLDYISSTTLKIDNTKSVEVDIYGFTVVDENNNTILDLIPVRIGSVGDMYDRISDKLMGGTGSFILGNDKTT